MIVNYKEDDAHLEMDNKTLIEIDLDDADFDEMEADLEEETDYD